MPRKFWQFRNATEPGEGDLLIYGPIGSDDGLSWLFDELSPKQFREELDALGDISHLRVFINSPGGDVFAGQAIHSILKRHPANVTVYIDGLAASAAVLPVMAGDKVIMPRNAMMMVHNPWTIAVGDSSEFRKVADTLDRVREAIISAYEDKTGMDRDELLAMLEAETWMSAEEAVENGFADEIEEARPIAASALGHGKFMVNGVVVDLSRYDKLPKLPWGLTPESKAPTKRDVEKALRDAGLSARDAKAFTSAGWKAFAGTRDEGPGDSEEAQKVTIEYERLRALINAA